MGGVGACFSSHWARGGAHAGKAASLSTPTLTPTGNFKSPNHQCCMSSTVEQMKPRQERMHTERPHRAGGLKPTFLLVDSVIDRASTLVPTFTRPQEHWQAEQTLHVLSTHVLTSVILCILVRPRSCITITISLVQHSAASILPRCWLATLASCKI